MKKKPKLKMEELKLLLKVYETYSILEFQYELGGREPSIKELFCKEMECNDPKELSELIIKAIRYQGVEFADYHNGLFEFLESKENYFDAKKYRIDIQEVIKKTKEEMEEARLEEIHEMLSKTKIQEPSNDPNNHKRGEKKRTEKERNKTICYELYDRKMAGEHPLKSESLIKKDIAKEMHCTVKTITRYLQERTE